MGADTGALSGLMKEVYEPGISEGVNNFFPLTKEFPLESADYKGGMGSKWIHHHGRNVSPFFEASGLPFCPIGPQDWNSGTFSISTRSTVSAVHHRRMHHADARL